MRMIFANASRISKVSLRWTCPRLDSIAEELVHAYARVASNQGANMVTRAEVVSLTPSGQTIRVGCASATKRSAG